MEHKMTGGHKMKDSEMKKMSSKKKKKKLAMMLKYKK